MGFQKLKCNNCGANLEVDDNLTVGFCQYCGCKFMLEEKVNVSVSVKVDNNNENKLKMAYNYIDDFNYEKAEKIFKSVLDDDASNYRAWWGRYICESYYSRYYGYTDRYGETSPFIKASILQKNLKYAYRAIENAPEEVAKEFKECIISEEEFIKNNL